MATSEQEKRELIGGGIDAARVEVRRNGIELPSREPEAGRFRRERGISSDAKVILFLGRLVSKKSPDMLLVAFVSWCGELANGRDAVLVLAGPDEGDGFLAQLNPWPIAGRFAAVLFSPVRCMTTPSGRLIAMRMCSSCLRKRNFGIRRERRRRVARP